MGFAQDIGPNPSQEIAERLAANESHSEAAAILVVVNTERACVRRL